MRPGWLNMPYKYVFPLIQIMKEKGKLNKLKVSGTSMEPTIKKGAIVEVDTSATDYLVGEIIVFINRNHLTTHRIVNIYNVDNEVYYVTKGDANDREVEHVKAIDVIGKVISYQNP